LIKKKYNIALFGNTNNYPLLLAESFTQLGHDVQFFINRKELLHRPESKYPDWSKHYPSWIHDCSFLSDEDIAYEIPSLDNVVNQLSNQNFDLVVLNDIGLALAGFLRCPYVAFLTGSDLSYYADYGMLDKLTAKWDPEFKRSISGRRNIYRFADLVTRQRDGILGRK